MTPESTSLEGGGFRTTHWTAVLNASDPESPRSGSALAELFQTYRYPLYAYLRRRGSRPEEAEDLIQEFFCRLLQRNFLQEITREGGKFRCFLLTVLKRLLAKERERARAQKRGGGCPLLSMDADAEARYQLEPADHLTPERLFERQWAFAVLDNVIGALRREYDSAGKTGLFVGLQPLLEGRNEGVSHAALGQALGMTEGAVKVAVHRFRKRYRELLRREVARGVAPEEVEAEMRHLIAVAIAFGYTHRRSSSR